MSNRGVEVIEGIEVINFILDFSVPPRQIRRLWRHPGLRIKARLGENLSGETCDDDGKPVAPLFLFFFDFFG